MATKPNVFSNQDMPPPGGYPKINTTRGIRPRGPPGWLIWASILGATAFGLYQIGLSSRDNRVNRKEKREGRMATLAFVKAEQDQEMARKIKDMLKEEAEVMKHRPEWVVKGSSRTA